MNAVWLDFVHLIPQLEVGSSQARVPSAPAAALLSSVAPQATPQAPTASATPAWGATEPPHTPAITPTAPPARVRPCSHHIHIREKVRVEMQIWKNWKIGSKVLCPSFSDNYMDNTSGTLPTHDSWSALQIPNSTGMGTLSHTTNSTSNSRWAS